MATNVELGPSTFSADDVKHIAEDCLSCLGFSVQSTTTQDKVVIQAERSSWSRVITGRRLGLVVRLTKKSDKWTGEAAVTDWRDNIGFFVAATVLGPVGWGAAALSAASRLFSDNDKEKLFGYLRDAFGKQEKSP